MKTIEVTDSTFDQLLEIHKVYERISEKNGAGYEVLPCDDDEACARSAINMMMGGIAMYNNEIRAVVFPDEICVNGRWVKKDGPESKDLGFL